MSDEAVLSHPLHRELLAKYEDLSVKLASLQHQYDQLLHLIKGARQERFIPVQNPEQPNLFHLPEAAEAPPATEKITIERSKRVKKKDILVQEGKRLPAHLPREVEVIEPGEDISGCTIIGAEESEQLHYRPGTLYVKVTRRPRYARPGGEGVVTAPMPDRMKEKSILGNSILAKVIADKYVYHMPLYRQAKQMEDLGICMAVSTLSDAVGYVSEAMIPVYEKLQAMIFSQNYLQADETPLKVLDPSVKGKTHLGYMWVYRAPSSGLVYFDYRPGRGREGPVQCLKNFRGYLQTDGYQVYDSFSVNEHITLVGCMAHARRKFFEAQNNDRSRAAYVLTELGKLYHTEDTLRETEATAEERKKVRQEQSRPVLEALKRWLDGEALKVTPKSPIGKAMA